jgi:hypothetical protein
MWKGVIMLISEDLKNALLAQWTEERENELS